MPPLVFVSRFIVTSIAWSPEISLSQGCVWGSCEELFGDLTLETVQMLPFAGKVLHFGKALLREVNENILLHTFKVNGTNFRIFP